MRRIVIDSSSRQASSNRRQPLLSSKSNIESASRGRTTVGEAAGGAAAECAAVCCCCPCVVVECVILAVYKVPTGICRKVWRKQQQKRLMKKKGLFGHHHHHHLQGTKSNGGAIPVVPLCDDEFSDVDFKEFEMIKVSIDGSAEVIELDKEMWEQFHNTGFWRSPSQRHVL